MDSFDLGGECHHDLIVLDLERNPEWKGSDTVPAECLCSLREILYYPVWFSLLHLVKGMARQEPENLGTGCLSCSDT